MNTISNKLIFLFKIIEERKKERNLNLCFFYSKFYKIVGCFEWGKEKWKKEKKKTK